MHSRWVKSRGAVRPGEGEGRGGRHHGRSIFIADVEHVQQLTPELMASAVHLFDLEDVSWQNFWGERQNAWEDPVTPEVEIGFWADGAGEAAVRVLTEDGTELATLSDDAERGLNYVLFELTVDEDRVEAYRELCGEPEEEDDPRVEASDDGRVYLLPGTYSVEVTAGGETPRGTFTVEEPPEETDADAPPAYPEEYGEGR